MTLNPITALSEQLQKLINEHGSASILRDHLSLFKDQLVLQEKKSAGLETKLAASEKEKAVLQAKIEILEKKIQQLTKESEELRRKIQKNDKFHDTLLDKEKADILLLLFKRRGEAFTFQIAKSLNISEDIAKYHLQELHINKFVTESSLPYRGLPGQHSWSIDDKGTKYLIENKLIS